MVQVTTVIKVGDKYKEQGRVRELGRRGARVSDLCLLGGIWIVVVIAFVDLHQVVHMLDLSRILAWH